MEGYLCLFWSLCDKLIKWEKLSVKNGIEHGGLGLSSDKKVVRYWSDNKNN